MKDVVDVRRELTGTLGSLLRNAGRCDFVNLTVVLGIVVEELVVSDHFGDGEHHRLLLGLIASHGDFGSLEEAFHHHVVALHHGLADGRGQLVFVLHLGHAERTAVGGGLHEARHADALFNLVVADQLFVAFADEQALGHAHAKAAQVVVEHELVEGHGLYEYAAGAVRQVDKLEIALHDAVLAGCSVDGDIGIVEHHQTTILHEREVVTVDGGRGAVVQVDVPVHAFHVDDIHIVTFFVEEGIKSLGGAQ